MTQPSRSTPKSWLAIALLSIASALLGACGGGGAATTTNNGETSLSIAPDGGTLYAGLPYTFTVFGGRSPYFVSSSEYTILRINEVISGNQFTLIPAQPGVVDATDDPNIVPSRTVTLFVNDSRSGVAGTTPGAQLASNPFLVLRNFLTGYGVNYTSTCAASGTTAAQACSGVESIANFSPISSGILSGNRAMRVERISGDFDWVVEGTNTLTNTLNFTTDHSGVGHATLKVRVGAVTQIATYRLIDVVSTLNVVQQFIISGVPPPGAMTLIPSTLTFTGALSTRCGTGSADILIFDGKAPFTIQNTEPNLSASPTTVLAPDNRFTVNAFNPNLCLTGATVVVSDFEGRRATLTVNTAAGSTTPPPLTVSPGAVTLTCAANVATVAVVGGVGGNSAVSSMPRVVATVGGTSMQITRLLADGATGPFPTAVTITVTDGATVATVAVTSPASCP